MTIKKLLSLTLTLALCISAACLTACSNTDESDGNNASLSSEAQTTSEADADSSVADTDDKDSSSNVTESDDKSEEPTVTETSDAENEPTVTETATSDTAPEPTVTTTEPATSTASKTTTTAKPAATTTSKSTTTAKPKVTTTTTTKKPAAKPDNKIPDDYEPAIYRLVDEIEKNGCFTICEKFPNGTASVGRLYITCDFENMYVEGDIMEGYEPVLELLVKSGDCHTYRIDLEHMTKNPSYNAAYFTAEQVCEAIDEMYYTRFTSLSFVSATTGSIDGDDYIIETYNQVYDRGTAHYTRKYQYAVNTEGEICYICSVVTPAASGSFNPCSITAAADASMLSPDNFS